MTEQRLAGAIQGAAVAAFFLVTVRNKHALEAVVLAAGG